jgi:hypothetical protein
LGHHHIITVDRCYSRFFLVSLAIHVSFSIPPSLLSTLTGSFYQMGRGLRSIPCLPSDLSLPHLFLLRVVPIIFLHLGHLSQHLHPLVRSLMTMVVPSYPNFKPGFLSMFRAPFQHLHPLVLSFIAMVVPCHQNLQLWISTCVRLPTWSLLTTRLLFHTHYSISLHLFTNHASATLF